MITPKPRERGRRAVLALVAVGSAMAACADGDPLADPARRVSYSLGHQIGADLAEQGGQVDLDALRRGLEDGLADRAAALPDDVRNALLLSLKQDIVARKRDDRIRGTSSLREAGASFLASNRLEPGVVALDSGVQYRIVREGSGRPPGAGDRVKVRYRSRRLDGAVFHDSMSEGSQPEVFVVGALIDGLIEALQLMPAGSRWEIFIPPDLAFGRRGPLQDHTVVYDLELIEVLEPGTAGLEDAS
jgi:FKBP-type peptidyl-prolyl cis-trans isomerase FklB